MFNWEEFEHLHVVRKLKEILSQWWNVEVFFADDRGFIRNMEKGEEKAFSNPVCNLVVNTALGYENFSEFCTNTTQKIRNSGADSLVDMWGIGLMASVFPIYLADEFMGTVIAVGYFEDKDFEKQKKHLQKSLKEMGLPAQDVDEAANSIKSVNKSEENYFNELVGLIAEEIITLHNEISIREERISELNKELGIRYKYDAMIGKSKPMQELYTLLDKIKESESTVMVQGENGTGKELIARAIHYNSPRKDRVFVTQNCSAFNDNLLDSELFGHVKGSFTGATRDKKGLFEVANGGTFFLDEIGDMSQAMQVKILRVLQEGTFIPVGATEHRKVDVRVIAATNKDLKDMVERGEFREDLYYRINVINIYVPALRERKEDIPLLMDHFLDKTAKEKNAKKKTVAKRAMEKLLDYNWPGNVRELENEIERLNVLSGSESKVTADMLSIRIKQFGEKGKIQGVRVQGKLKDSLEELEREMIKEGLRRSNWNKSKLAKELGISRAGLIMKVEKYGLDKRKMTKK
ncbi:MAG: nitrogen fixation protein NifA [Deltaproteobacteria bacterium RIFCSPHIGHO2_02_FULL_40_11]|nr:MAG: nitrogen fixation protein NifA [Deltaproteobacteria bacterium RIFCSPHIGHO2_02_FULL_40_11]